MSDSILQLMQEASRPFKDFTFEINGKSFDLKTRNLSAIESDFLTQAFNEEFDRVASELEAGSVDTTMLRRSLQRQSKEKLCRLIISADRTEFLQEASTELDDKPFSDKAVQELAKKKQEEGLEVLLSKSEDLVLDAAMERRAFVIASIKATDYQNLTFLRYAVYHEEKGEVKRLFATTEDVACLDRKTIGDLISKVYDTLRGVSAPDPLKSPRKKASAKRT